MDQQEYKRHVKDLETKRDETINKAREIYEKKMAALDILYKDIEWETATPPKQSITKNLNNKNNHRPPDYGVVSNEVGKILESFPVEATFTTQDIFKKLDDSGLDFKRSTISGVLNRLSKNVENGLKLTRRGKGSKPSHYKRIKNKVSN